MSVVPFADLSQRQLWMPERVGNAARVDENSKSPSRSLLGNFELSTSRRPSNPRDSGIELSVALWSKRSFLEFHLGVLCMYFSLPKGSPFYRNKFSVDSTLNRTMSHPSRTTERSRHLCFTPPRKLHVKWFREANIEYSRTDNLYPGSRNYTAFSYQRFCRRNFYRRPLIVVGFRFLPSSSPQ